MNTDPNYILITLGIVSIIVEVVLGAALGFELLILGIIMIISGGVGTLFSSFTIALITFLVLTTLYIAAGRKFIRNKFNIATTATNIDDVMGKKGTVVKEIEAGKYGQVKIDGETWRATSEQHQKVGSHVTVESVSGVTITVT